MIAPDIIAIIESIAKGMTMKMKRIIIQVPSTLKAQLDAERRQGTTASGLIRHLLEQHFKGKRAA
jgi:hypothetical protein